jgi:hypothetical protein
LINWIKKEDPTICCLQETHVIDRNNTDLGQKVGRRFIKPMAAGIAIIISDNVDFKLT